MVVVEEVEEVVPVRVVLVLFVVVLVVVVVEHYCSALLWFAINSLAIQHAMSPTTCLDISASRLDNTHVFLDWLPNKTTCSWCLPQQLYLYLYYSHLL